MSTSKDNADKVTEDKTDIHEAISWYNQALGFHVEAGHGNKRHFEFVTIMVLLLLKFNYRRSCLFWLLLQESNSHSPTLMQKGRPANFRSQFTMEMTSTHVSIYCLLEASISYIIMFTKNLVTWTVYNRFLIWSSVLDCDLQLDDINDMVRELNKSNDLFRFVRLMRDKFLKSTLSGK